MGDSHIVSSFDKELEKIHSIIMRMAGLTETQLSHAIEALCSMNIDLAKKVRQSDQLIDDMEVDIGNEVVRLIALRQPVADDLRSAVASLKIASELERVGDLAKNIAKRSIAISSARNFSSFGSTLRMSKTVQNIFKDAIDAFVNSDVNRAIEVWHRDGEVDEMHTSLFRELLTLMAGNPDSTTACTHMLFIVKNLERIGDHATNISEIAHFLHTGEQIEGSRPKRDETSSLV